MWGFVAAFMKPSFFAYFFGNLCMLVELRMGTSEGNEMGIGNNRESEEMRVRSSLTRSEARVIASLANFGRKALCLLLVAALIVGFMPLASAPEALAATSSTASS